MRDELKLEIFKFVRMSKIFFYSPMKYEILTFKPCNSKNKNKINILRRVENLLPKQERKQKTIGVFVTIKNSLNHRTYSKLTTKID